MLVMKMPKFGNENKNVAFIVKLPESVAKRIEEIANREKNPKAAVLRRLIIRGLENER